MRRWAQRLGLAALGVALALVLVELAARLLHIAPAPPPPSYYKLNALVGYFPKPYERFVYYEGATRHLVTFNNLGLPDANHDYTKKPGVQRILFLGDSFTAALQVPRTENYISRLREWLPTDYETINAGFNGWGTDRQYLFYREEGHRYRSDLVVLQIFVGNDVLDNGAAVLGYPLHPGSVHFELDDAGQLAEVGDPSPLPPEQDGPGTWLRDHLFTYHLVQAGLEGIADPGPTPQAARPIPPAGQNVEPWREFYVFGPLDETGWAPAWEVTRQLMRRLREEVEAHGGRLVAVIVPVSEQEDPAFWEGLVKAFGVGPDWDPHRPSRLFAEMLRDEGIPYLDLLPPTMDYIQQTGHWLRYPIPHWTPEGHCVAAVAIYNWLVGEQLIKTPPHTLPLDAVNRCAG